MSLACFVRMGDIFCAKASISSFVSADSRLKNTDDVRESKS